MKINIFKILPKFLYSYAFNRKFPLAAGIQITNRCNLRCSYCNYPSNIDSKELDSKEWLNLINEMSKCGVKTVSISGGEPMLKDGIIDIIKFCKEKGMCVILSSNGYSVKDNVSELTGVDNIGISLDGDEPSHDLLRGKGSYKIALDAILACKKSGMNVSHGMVLTKLNVDKIDKILKFAKDNKTYSFFQVLEFNPQDSVISKNWKKSEDIKKLVLSEKEIKETFSYLAGKKKDKFPIGNSLGYLKAMAKWPYYPMFYNKKAFRNVRCFAGQFYFFVYPDGKMFACNMFHSESKNLKEGDFYTNFKELKRNKECNACLLPCHLERNLLFSMSPDTALTWFHSTLRKS